MGEMSAVQTYTTIAQRPSTSSTRDPPGAVNVTGWDAKSILDKVREWVRHSKSLKSLKGAKRGR